MNFDLILFRVAKVTGILLGAFILVYETVADHVDRPYLYAAALLMMGLQIGETVEKIATGFGMRTQALDKSKRQLEGAEHE